MQTIDFGRSFFTFRIDLANKPQQTMSHKAPYDLNNARIQIDCRCEIRDNESGKSYEFCLGANCKTERVGVEKDVWLSPNADFRPVCSTSQFLVIKSYDHIGREKEVFLFPKERGHQPDRQTVNVADAFDTFKIDLHRCEGELLTTSQQIVNATLENARMVARTEIQQGRYTAVVEYPITTMNANERDWVYQTDTGPVLVPDLTRSPEDLINGFQLAFSAFNCPEWVEFIVRAPTPIPQGGTVYHYSKSVRVEGVKNSVVRLA
jgi:hypothetical protein